MKSIFQLLLNNGFVGYTAVTASKNSKKKGKAGSSTETSSYLRVHVLVLRYLQLIVKVVNVLKFTDVMNNSIALPVSSSRPIDCHNGSNVMTAYYKGMKPEDTTSSAFFWKLLPKLVLDLYLYVDPSFKGVL